MLLIVAQALFFFLPAYMANMFPVVFGKVKKLEHFKKPIDHGKKFGKKSLFGEHKTYFGFLIGVSGALLTGLLQSAIYSYFPDSRMLFLEPYPLSFALQLGFLLGFGSLLGDLIKSFFKRRLGIASGAPFFPFDQLDFVAGGLLLAAPLFLPSWEYILTLVLFTPLLHFLSNVLGYSLGLKKVWW